MKESAIACVLLAVIVGCGIFIRFQATNESMWLDECHTAWAVDADSPSAVAQRAADGNQPPLYFEIVWAVTQLLGLSEFSLRVVSLVAGSLLMIVAAIWAKGLTNRWSAAVLVAGLIAFDGQFIYYASEARSYALVQLIGLIQAIFFWRILARQYKHDAQASESVRGKAIHSLALRACILPLTIWTLLSIALLYCHYTSVWVLAAEGFIVLLLAVMQRKLPLNFLIAGGAIVAAMVPVWLNISTVFDRRSNWSSVSSTAQLWSDVEPWLVHWIMIPIGFALAAWLVSVIRPSEEQQSADRSKDWLLWLWIALWAIIGPIGIAAADWLEIAPMALVRYSAVCWVAMALLAGLCLKQYSRPVSWAVAAIILGSSFFGNWWTSDLYEAGRLPPFRSEDWVTTVTQIAESDSHEPIFQFADVIEDIDALTDSDPRFQQYLLFPILGADAVRDGEHRIPDRQQVIAMPTWNLQFTKQQLNSIRDAKGGWLIFRGDLDYALIIPGELERFLGQPIEFKFIPNERIPDSSVHLIRIRTQPAN